MAEPAEIAASVAEITAGEKTGGAYVLQAGRAPEPVAFPQLDLARTNA
ncbi:hypothetical protein [Streptomyces sp. NPDC007205]